MPIDANEVTAMEKPCKLMLDDEWFLEARYPGEDWICVQTVARAQEVLRLHQGNVTHLSIDNDLGDGIPEGNTLTKWLCEQYFVHGLDYWPTESITIHSRNACGRQAMKGDINNPRCNPRPWMLEDVLI